MSRRLAAATACVVAAMGLLAGCGMPTDGSARPIPSSEIPAALFASPPATAAPPTTLQPNHGTPTSIYFFDVSLVLVPQQRELRAPLTLQGILNALDDGPTGNEFKLGIQTFIPVGAHLLGIGVKRQTATVGLDSSFSSMDLTQTINAFAQIVYSVTALDGVHSVRFEYGGTAFPAEIGNGQIVYTPVTRHDYAQLTERG